MPVNMPPDIEVRKVHLIEANRELTEAWGGITNPAGLKGAEFLGRTFLQRVPPGGVHLLRVGRLARDLGAEGKLVIAIAGAPPSGNQRTVLYSAALRYVGGENDPHPWFRSAIQLFETPLKQYLDQATSGIFKENRLMAFVAGEDNEHNGLEPGGFRFGIPGQFRGFHSFPGPGEVSLSDPAVGWFLGLAGDIARSFRA